MAKKLHLLYGLILLCFFLAACATPGDQDEFEGELVNYVSSSCGLFRLFSRIKLSNTVLVRYGNSMLEVPQSLLMLSSRQNESTDKIFSHRKMFSSMTVTHCQTFIIHDIEVTRRVSSLSRVSLWFSVSHRQRIHYFTGFCIKTSWDSCSL